MATPLDHDPEPHLPGADADPDAIEAQAIQQRPRARASDQDDSKPTPRDKWVRLTIEVPDYVATQLKDRAHKNGVTVRHLIFRALRTSNIRIREADMAEDGRSSRKSRRR